MTVAYTMRYVSGETAIDEITSFKSDIWSFGLVMYEVLTGIRVWEKFKNQSKIIIGLSQK